MALIIYFVATDKLDMRGLSETLLAFGRPLLKFSVSLFLINILITIKLKVSGN